MKRSEINQAIRRALALLDENNMALPPFGYWGPEEWLERLPQLTNLRRVMLGWDVSDFGSGDFAHCGSVLFTARNGKAGRPDAGTPYAEKLIFQLHDTAQEIPFHYHCQKKEDIINRSGGLLMLELYNADANGGLDRESGVHVRMDGVDMALPAGAVVEVPKGGSITLTPRLYHRFWAKQGAGDLIVGEISSINDDNTDNVFLHAPQRFAQIEEDEAPLCPLCNEYDAWIQGGVPTRLEAPGR